LSLCCWLESEGWRTWGLAVWMAVCGLAPHEVSRSRVK
jgi:hypothetical protein